MQLLKVIAGYGKNIIINGAEAKIQKGEIISLIGPNGGGKSTLLKTISGQLRLLGGTVHIGEDDIKSISLKDLSERLSIVTTERVKPELMSCFDVVMSGRLPYTGSFGSFSEADYEAGNRASTLMKIDKLKEIAREKLDELVGKALTYVNNAELRASINTFYNEEADKIQAVSSQEEANELPETIKADTEAFIANIINDLKDEARKYIDGIILPAIDKIEDDEIKSDLEEFYDTEADKIQAISSLEGIESTIAEIKKDTEDFVKSELNKELIRLKNAALDQLSTLVTAGLNKLPNEELKTQLSTFYDTEQAKLEAVTTIDAVPTT